MPRPFAVIGLTVFGVLAVLCAASSVTVIIALVFFTLCLALSLAYGKLRKGKVFPVAFAAAALACLLLTAVNEFYYYPQMKLVGSDREMTLTVTSDCETEYGNYYFDAEADSIDGEKASVNLRLMFSSVPEIGAYDRLEGTFTVYKLGNTADSIHLSRKSENRFLGAYTDDEAYSVISKGINDRSFGHRLFNIRSAVKGAVMRMLPNDCGALAVALILGDRSGLSDEAYLNLRECGVTHIICVSGLHISLWSCAVLWLLRKIRLGEKLACALTIPAVIFFMLIAGMTYSVMRSGIMMILALLANILFRKSDSLNSLGAALTAILCVNPYAAGNTGLQLSALATLGIVLYSEYIQPKFNEFCNKHSLARAFSAPAGTAAVTLTATAFTLPVTLGVFGRLSLCVLPANLLIIWAAEACMITALIGAAVSLIPGVFNLPGFVSGVLAKYILKITQLLSGVNFPDITLSERDIYTVLCGVFALCALVALMAYSGKKAVRSGAAVIAALFITVSAFYVYRDRKITAINVLDAGNGCAVLISKGGSSVLVGCGGDSFNGANIISRGISDSGSKLKAVVIPDDKKAYKSFLAAVPEIKETERIYCDGIPAGFNKYENSFRPLTEKITVDGMNFEFDIRDGKAANCFIHTDDTDAAIVFDTAAKNEKIQNCSVVICPGDYPDAIGFSCLKALIFQADNGRGYDLCSKLSAKGIPAFSTAECGNLIVTAENGAVNTKR